MAEQERVRSNIEQPVRIPTRDSTQLALHQKSILNQKSFG